MTDPVLRENPGKGPHFIRHFGRQRFIFCLRFHFGAPSFWDAVSRMNARETYRKVEHFLGCAVELSGWGEKRGIVDREEIGYNYF